MKKDLVEISWSPIMMQDLEVQDRIRFSEMKYGVLYKLYLGFNNNTLDLFSSLCQLEETEGFVEASKNGKRCLQIKNEDIKAPRNRTEVNAFEFDTPDLKVISSYGHPKVVIEGKEGLTNLKAAVVMAHVFREGQGPLTFAYPPVDFHEVQNFDDLLTHNKYRFLIIAFSMFGIGMFMIVFCLIKATMRRNIQEVTRQVSTTGIAMQALPTQSNASISVDTQSEQNSTKQNEDLQHAEIHEDDDKEEA